MNEVHLIFNSHSKAVGVNVNIFMIWGMLDIMSLYEFHKFALCHWRKLMVQQ